MLVTERSMGTLIVEEGKSSSLIVGGSSAGIGAVLVAIGGVKGEYLMIAVGAVFLFYGVKALLFSRAHTHRFDRLRRKVVIEARGLWKAERREIPFEHIADIVVEKAGRRPASTSTRTPVRSASAPSASPTRPPGSRTRCTCTWTSRVGRPAPPGAASP